MRGKCLQLFLTAMKGTTTFLQTSVSNALYYRRWRRKQILNFPPSLSAQYADADSWLKSFLKKHYLPETQEGNDTLSTTTDGLLATIS